MPLLREDLPAQQLRQQAQPAQEPVGRSMFRANRLLRRDEVLIMHRGTKLGASLRDRALLGLAPSPSRQMASRPSVTIPRGTAPLSCAALSPWRSRSAPPLRSSFGRAASRAFGVAKASPALPARAEARAPCSLLCSTDRRQETVRPPTEAKRVFRRTAPPLGRYAATATLTGESLCKMKASEPITRSATGIRWSW